MSDVVIEVGLNEAVSRTEHAGVPITPSEIAADILECGDAGASIVHFHARDPETGAQRYGDTALYREVVARVRAAGSRILMYPTYPPFFADPARIVEERFGHVLALADEAKLEMKLGPLDMGSLNLVFGRGGELLAAAREMPVEQSVYRNPAGTLWKMAEEFDRRDMITSLAIFEPGHLRLAMAFLEAGLCTRPVFKFFLSGSWLHGPLPDRAGLEFYLRLLDQLRGEREIEWMCAPSGLAAPGQVDSLVRAALELGGHVRVGVGDNPVAAAGRSNRALVEEVVETASEVGRSPATPDEWTRRFARAR